MYPFGTYKLTRPVDRKTKLFLRVALPAAVYKLRKLIFTSPLKDPTKKQEKISERKNKEVHLDLFYKITIQKS